MTIKKCDHCGKTDENDDINIHWYLASVHHLYLDLCDECRVLYKQKLKDAGYTYEQGYDV
jgi:hypothetical protein